MTAGPEALDELSARLWQNGVAAFCPTTLSESFEGLLESVARIGKWIRSGTSKGALPLGIHLEGPFIHPGACGAHPIEHIRPFKQSDLELLWKTSEGTLKLLTIAPEKLTLGQLKTLSKWAREQKVVLSLGHSKATEAQANLAFSHGFSGITHAWNALSFHHREPGALGAALGRDDVHVELILDQVHVAPSVIDWMERLHPRGLCYVSDAVPPAGAKPGTWHRFGPLKARLHDGACRLESGALAGGGYLLSEAYSNWLASRCKDGGAALLKKTLKSSLGRVTTEPLNALGLSTRLLSKRRVRWVQERRAGLFTAIPVPFAG